MPRIPFNCAADTLNANLPYYAGIVPDAWERTMFAGMIGQYLVNG